MRLIEANERIARAWPGRARYIEEMHVRGRLPEVRPSALEKRGAPALSEIGSLLHGLSDADRWCPACGTMGCHHTAPVFNDWMNHARHEWPVRGCHLCEVG